MTMDARKQRVLQAIVALYGLEGEPVGSSVLANYFDMAVSSATLRNEMAALTKLGLLEQPHTSAGRVPSAKGYRYYLDHLLTDDQPLDRVTRARVDAVFASLDHEPEKLAQGAAKALAAISGCTAAVSTPCAEDLCIAHYEVVQVGRRFLWHPHCGAQCSAGLCEPPVQGQHLRFRHPRQDHHDFHDHHRTGAGRP